MRPIMILGCTSDAGKSFLTTALCRYFANRGVKVAPFKAQNISNNAAVTENGGEISRAQFVQALAAKVMPEVVMNPVLLKPESNNQYQVIVQGQVDRQILSLPWRDWHDQLWPKVCASLFDLLQRFELVVIEGAGSPAEINLRSRDIVNMKVALECQARVFLVADIDRGGAFAHLLGTWHCLSDNEKQLIEGFVLNKFRGKRDLLGNAMGWLAAKTKIPTVAIVPYHNQGHLLPEEDVLFRQETNRGNRVVQIRIGLLLYPFASNLEEFDPFFAEEGVQVTPVQNLQDLTAFDIILLPGSKSTLASVEYLRSSGLALSLHKAAQKGRLIFGVCGGMQLLGQAIIDPSGSDGQITPRPAQGLGLLAINTVMMPIKTVQWTEVEWIEGGKLKGYEIHMGHSVAEQGARAFLSDGKGWQNGNIWGTYLHGLFENTAFRQFYLEKAGWKGHAQCWAVRLEAELEKMAGIIEQSGWAQFL